MDAQPLPWFLSLGSSNRGVLAVDLVGLVLTVLAFAADTTAPSGRHMPARVARRMVIANLRGGLKWEIGCKRSSHDIAPSENGNPLCWACPVKVVAITSAKQVVWQYE
jgi:hypothetical protein